MNQWSKNVVYNGDKKKKKKHLYSREHFKIHVE